jgi:conjugative relaxase-like TrwC/TraI family protein
VQTLRPIRVIVGAKDADGGSAGAIAAYVLDVGSSPQAFAREGDDSAPPRANSVWVGSATTLKKLGLAPGQEVQEHALTAALEGRHAVTGERVRGKGRVVRSVELTFSVPKSVSVVWCQATMAQRAEIEAIILRAAQRTLEYLTQTKKVVRRRVGDGTRVSEVASGMAASMTLHVTSRVAHGDVFPAPQLHLDCQLVGVESSEGELVTPNSWPLYRRGAPLEGGAMFRGWVAADFVRQGYAIRGGTGVKRRFFEIDGVSEELCEDMSPRAQEVRQRQRELELVGGVPLSSGEVALLALETRQAKDPDIDPVATTAFWDERCAARGFGTTEAALLKTHRGYEQDEESRWATARATIAERMEDFGPTLTAEAARAVAIEVGAALMDPDDALALVDDMQDNGELLALAGRGGTEVTTPRIREREKRIMSVATAAAGRGDAPLSAAARAHGKRVAEAKLGATLDDEQRDAFMKLTDGAGWTILTGPAGAGKGPTLHAVAAAYGAEGWRVVACGLDGTTAERLGTQIASNSSTVAQLKARVEMEMLEVDRRTLILIDEATKIGAEEWEVIAKLVHENRARLLAIGHKGQLSAIKLAGLFERMESLGKRIPVAKLLQVRRHRDPLDKSKVHPWMGDYLTAVERGRAMQAVRILRKHDAIKLYDTREQAMRGMVKEWGEYRRSYALEQSVLVVHGSNKDVDEVNVLAQGQRLDLHEIGGESVSAVDRDYRLYVGDLVILRNSPYYASKIGERVENGKVGIITALDAKGKTVTVSLITDDDEPRREVTFDLGEMRRNYERWKHEQELDPSSQRIPPPALRLNYASHPFPLQGATLDAGARFGVAGREPTYSGDSRFRFRFTAHLARPDLGNPKHKDAKLFREYARKIRRSVSRHASVTLSLTDTSISVTSPRWGPTVDFPVLDADRIQTITRDDVWVPDRRLDRLRELLGPRRAEIIGELADKWANDLAGRDEGSLLKIDEAAAGSVGRLDRETARETVRLEADEERVRQRLDVAEREADRLEELSQRPAGKGQRAERRGQEQEAAVQRRAAAAERRDLEDLGRAQETLWRDRRHPDQWLERWREDAAVWVAVGREQDVSREVEIRNAVERALGDPSSSVQEAIGERPGHTAPQRQEWDELARRLERNRLTPGHEHPSGQQRDLERRVNDFRAERGMDRSWGAGDDGRSMTS